MCQVMYYYSFLDHLFFGVFLSFQVLKTNRSNLISESLTSCLKIRKFLPDLHHSFPVSSLCRVTPKIAV